jgi:hypothetical protein
MYEVGYFSVADRRSEKREARDRDEHLIVSGQASPQEISQRNGMFSSLAPSQVRLVQRRAEIRVE